MGEMEKLRRFISDEEKVSLYIKLMHHWLGKAGKSAAEDLVDSFRSTGTIHTCSCSDGKFQLPSDEVHRLSTSFFASAKAVGFTPDNKIFSPDDIGDVVVTGMCLTVCTTGLIYCLGACGAGGNLCYASCVIKFGVCMAECGRTSG